MNFLLNYHSNDILQDYTDRLPKKQRKRNAKTINLNIYNLTLLSRIISTKAHYYKVYNRFFSKMKLLRNILRDYTNIQLFFGRRSVLQRVTKFYLQIK